MERNWIPVSDSLPDNEEQVVWVTFNRPENRDKHYVAKAVFSEDGGGWSWYSEYDSPDPVYYEFDILAWMPYTEPEPYHG